MRLSDLILRTRSVLPLFDPSFTSNKIITAVSKTGDDVTVTALLGRGASRRARVGRSERIAMGFSMQGKGGAGCATAPGGKWSRAAGCDGEGLGLRRVSSPRGSETQSSCRSR